MRLFIAIDFPEDIKDGLLSDAKKIRGSFFRANFSRRENYHLTLVFLGEVPPARVKEIAAVMNGCAFPDFRLTVGEGGRFRRDGGDTLWRKVTAPKTLFDIQKQLFAELKAHGFSFDNREFKPHITIAREAILADGAAFSGISFGEPLSFTVSSITLMRSDRINGVLTYTPIHIIKSRRLP